MGQEGSNCGEARSACAAEHRKIVRGKRSRPPEESLAAAHMVLEAASSSNVLKMLWWRISGRLERAKTFLGSMVNGGVVGVNAMITARQLIVDGLHKMRQLAADPRVRPSMTTEAVLSECLFAPATVVRQAKTSCEVAGCPFRRGSLFIFGLGSASKGAANRDTSSSSIRVGAAVPQKSGCLRYWKACGRVCQLRFANSETWCRWDCGGAARRVLFVERDSIKIERRGIQK